MHDITIRIDCDRLEYIGYTEHTPGALLVAPSRLLNRRVEDVVGGELATTVDVAAWTARKHRVAQEFTYTLLGTSRRAHVVVRDSCAYLNITHLGTAAEVASDLNGTEP